ncbi:LHFPL tetraspan subfamily member 4 protein [Chionoecetes opilio]|uniref:LHFPL tetraspan subfamily member 4 protein n=1 Tax=Chionoecetes opilio TaxID=41210 RepID=A0A8J4XSN8_CHIOP|nr:LHFPL tetraspan subfamily member 4 protein [Chionoecetes opilio]
MSLARQVLKTEAKRHLEKRQNKHLDQYADQGHIYTTNYVRNSKAIGVLWAVFTICFAIINIVVFVQPQWIGDTQDSKGTGYFGLWQWCAGGGVGGGVGGSSSGRVSGVELAGRTLECRGQLDQFSTLLNTPSRVATVLVGLSVVLTLLTICAMLLFFFLRSSTVFHLAGSMQLLAALTQPSSALPPSALLLGVGVAVFPAGWSASEVRAVCGPTARHYHVGECEVRWALVLAVIGVLDATVLATLAFVLASRHVKLQPEPEPLYGGSVYKGQMNTGFVGDVGSLAGSRKSLNLQPVMLMPHPDHDRYSEFSHHTARSKNSPYRAHYASSVQNFQL